MNDYSSVLAFMRPRSVEGDIVEIGAFVGKGTRQLCEAFPNKTVYAVDIFDIYADETENMGGIAMSKFYEGELQGRDQFEVFTENTRGLENLVVVRGDSTKVKFPKSPLFLTIIDGGHSPEVLKKDFKKAAKSAFVAFHDYKHDLPEVTAAIDEITEGLERYEIGNTFLVVVCN